jgi:hypothetical protein
MKQSDTTPISILEKKRDELKKKGKSTMEFTKSILRLQTAKMNEKQDSIENQ